MLCAFSKFQPSAPPVLSGRFDFKRSSSSAELPQPLQVCCHQPKATLKNIPFESSQVHLDDLVTGILDVFQPVQRGSRTSRGNGIIDKFDLRYSMLYSI